MKKEETTHTIVCDLENLKLSSCADKKVPRSPECIASAKKERLQDLVASKRMKATSVDFHKATSTGKPRFPSSHRHPVPDVSAETHQRVLNLADFEFKKETNPERVAGMWRRVTPKLFITKSDNHIEPSNLSVYTRFSLPCVQPTTHIRTPNRLQRFLCNRRKHASRCMLEKEAKKQEDNVEGLAEEKKEVKRYRERDMGKRDAGNPFCITIKHKPLVPLIFK